MNHRRQLILILIVLGAAGGIGCLKSVERGLDEQSIEGNITQDVPGGWVLFGPVDGEPAYDFYGGADSEITHGGRRSATFFAVNVTKDDQARLTQRFLADRYRGQRVRFSGYLKTNQVNGWTGLWMRIDTVNNVGWAFDDMEEHAVSGTTDWTRYEIVLDVPDDGAAIYLGAHLYGRGQVWLDDCQFEVVGDDVPATDGDRLRGGRKRTYTIPRLMEDEPVNMDFEETEFL
jgi:hypothetical protein